MTDAPGHHDDADEGGGERTLSELIGLIYEAALQPELWPEVLRRVTLFTPSVSATLYAHDRVARTPTFHQSYGNDPVYVAQYIERWAASNPIIEAMARLAPGDVAGLAAILDYEAFTRTPFFQEWGVPQGVCDSINVMLERTPTRVASLSLIRGNDHGLADEAAIRRLKLLVPHLLRAVRIGNVLEHATIAHDRISQALDALAEAVFLVNAGGGLVHANGPARALLADGLSLAGVYARRAALRIGKQRTGPKAAAEDRVLVEICNGTPHVCHVLPLDLPARPADGSKLQLIVIKPGRATFEAVANAKAVFALTGREGDVLFGLAEIGSIPAVAAALGISTNSVRSHVKTLFQKTGTNRQAELVALLSTMESPFRPPDRHA